MPLVIANRYDEPSEIARVSGQCTLNVTRDNTSACNETSFGIMLGTCMSSAGYMYVQCSRGSDFLLFLILILSQVSSFSQF